MPTRFASTSLGGAGVAVPLGFGDAIAGVSCGAALAAGDGGGGGGVAALCGCAGASNGWNDAAANAAAASEK
jgi:hypothetical protein